MTTHRRAKRNGHLAGACSYGDREALVHRQALTATSSREVADLVRTHLSERVVLPKAACRDLHLLDSAPESAAWARKAWEGFSALNAYATYLATPDRRSADFWSWCQHSGDPQVWPATPKHLAMVESASVRRRAKFASQRLLPVHRSVAEDGRLYMESHLKISTGGGMLAPRIYFHVHADTATVHVGFFGPHKHMSNTRT